MKSSRATIRDIARECVFSKPTASGIVTNRSKVRIETEPESSANAEIYV